MTLNPVQERLIRELMAYTQQKYPEVSLRTIIEGPENPNHLWLIVKGINWNDDDDRVMDFMEYTSLKEEDILVEYGYHFSLMPISLPGEHDRETPDELASVFRQAAAA
jgi:hypothetical protein